MYIVLGMMNLLPIRQFAVKMLLSFIHSFIQVKNFNNIDDPEHREV